MRNVVIPVAIAVLSLTSVNAEEFSYQNCECIDAVLYCFDPPTASYDYAPHDQVQTPTYYVPYDGSASRQTPTFATYSYDPPPSPVPPELVLLGFIALVAAAIVAACSSSSTPAIEGDISETDALTQKLEAAAREADAHIATFLEKTGREEADNG